MATAFVSGIIALIMSFNKTKQLNELNSFLNDFSMSINQFSPGRISLLNPSK
jgi:hypothetical protein